VSQGPLDFLYKFENISHSHFDIRYFKNDFIKIYFTVFRELCQKNVKKESIKIAADNFYKTLFLARDRDVKVHLHTIYVHLNKESSSETFLSKLFFIILNHYIKSCYKADISFAKVNDFSRAINDFIKYSASIDLNDLAHEEDQVHISEFDIMLSKFEYMRENKQKITLLNHYKSMPIKYSAEIVHTTKNSIIVHTHELQNAAALSDGRSYILANKMIENDYLVSVSGMLKNGTRLLVLSGFDKLESGIVNRNDLRVQVPNNTIISMKYNAHSCQAMLYDFSFGGLSVVCSKKINAPKYELFSIDLSNIIDVKESLLASLIHVSKFENAYKYHFKITFSIAQEKSVTDYINSIQKEIIKELKNM